MKNLLKAFSLSLILAICVAISTPALAYYGSLTLSVSPQGYGSNYSVVLNNAPAYSQVSLYTRQSSQLWTIINNFGQTDGSGYFSQVTTLSSDGTGSPFQVYAIAGGQQSQTVQVYPNGYSGGYPTYPTNPTYPTSGSLSLSQTTVTVNAGQNVSVTSYSSASNLYVSSNSNSSVVSASANGNQINFYGVTYGTSTVVICSTYPSGCASVYVTVIGPTSSNISFSPSSLNIATGQSQQVAIYNNVSGYPYSGNGYFISSNSNSTVANGYLSGSTLTVNGLNSGTATLVICQYGSNTCGNLNVTVGGNSNLSFSQSNVNLNINQNTNISITGGNGTGSYYISGNSNSSAVSASISGTTVYLLGQSNGSSTITICQNNNVSCGTIYVTVYGTSSGSTVWFSQSSVSLTGGQSQTLTIYSNNYGGSYYISSNSNPSAVSVNVVGNSLNLYGNGNGTSTLSVCQTSGSGCGTLTASSSGGSSGPLSFSQNNLNLNVGQSAAVTIYGGGYNNYYVSSNSNPGTVSANISGNTITVYGNTAGTASLVVCQNNGSSCSTLNVAVNAFGSGSISFVTSALTQPTVGQYYTFQLQATGGNPSYTYMLNSGSLPAGLNLSNSGLISGIAQAPVSTSFSVRATDNSGRAATANFTLTPTTSTSLVSYSNVLGAYTYQNGELINDGGTIYIIYKNTRTAFVSSSVFRALGYKFSNVTVGSTSDLVDSDYVVRNPRASHPWGTWIKSGQTVYFVHETGLIAVPDYNTFLNNGGSDSLVVPANAYDLHLPVLPAMTTNDPRLR